MEINKLLSVFIASIALLATGFAQAAAVAEMEPNGTSATGQVIAPASFTVAVDPDLHDDTLPTVSISGDIGLNPATDLNDIDFYCFTATAGQTLFMDIDGGGSLGNDMDTLLWLFNPLGTLIAEDDNSPITAGGTGSVSGDDSFIGAFNLPATGIYCAVVSAYRNRPNAISQAGYMTSPLSIGGSEDSGLMPDETFDNLGDDSSNDEGDYVLHISFGATSAIPVLQPLALGLLIGLLGVLGAYQRRRR